MNLQHTGDFAMARFNGDELSLDEVWGLLAELDSLNCSAIIDFRGNITELSRTEVLLIALKLQEQPQLRFHKIGLIGNGTDCGTTQIAEYARGRGISVKSFLEPAEAETWLKA